MFKVFNHDAYALRTLREIKIMSFLNHENVLSIKKILDPGSLENFKELYVITELLETDLG